MIKNHENFSYELTPEFIASLDAGPKLDSIVAWRVLRWTGMRAPLRACGGHGSPYSGFPAGLQRFSDRQTPPTYSSGIAHLGEVLDTLSQVTLTQKIGAWECQCFDGIGACVARAETLELAVCRCALLASLSPANAATV